MERTVWRWPNAVALTAWLSWSLGVTGCGKTSVPDSNEIRPDYCVEYPSNSYYCEGDRFGVDEAKRSVDRDGTLPQEAFLVAIHSSPAGGLAPDGLHSATGEWRLVYAAPDGSVLDYTALVDQVLLDQYSSDAGCTSDEAISTDGLVAQIEQGTVQLEDAFGVVYEPGTFSLNAFRDAACFSNVGKRNTLIHSQSDRPNPGRYTVEFDEQHPGGTICDFNADGCEE